MSIQAQKILSVNDLTLDEVLTLFSKTQKMKKEWSADRAAFTRRYSEHNKMASLIFLEPSTRTRLSFELACHRLNIKFIAMSGHQSTSVAKGEAHRDSFENIDALGADIIVFRSGTDEDLMSSISKTTTPVISGGYGHFEHPTQALLDAFTLFEEQKNFEAQKILYVGDVRHSRVFSSGQTLFESLGAEVAYCSPPQLKFLEGPKSEVKHYDDLQEALQWANVCIGLRLQKERHEGVMLSKNDYIANYLLSAESIKSFSTDGVLMHPGPYVPHVDFSPELLDDPRCKVREQVNNGAWVRAALLSSLLGIDNE